MSDPFGPWQGPWQQQPPPSPLPQPEPEKNNRWIVLATLAVVAVLVVVVMVIVAFIIDPRTESTPKRQAEAAQSSAAPQTTYSTSDPNAIRILTEEATCDEFKALNWDGTTLVVGLPNELTWSAQDRAAAADTARQFSEAADKVTPLMARASSNFVREMYGQLIAYARAFANWLPTTDGNLADRRYFDLGYASGAADRIVSSLCGTLGPLEADAYAPLVEPVPFADPPHLAAAGPRRFIEAQLAICPETAGLFSDFMGASDPYTGFKDPSGFADRISDLGHRSDNNAVDYLAIYGAQYLRADSKSSAKITGFSVVTNWVLLLLKYGCGAVGAGE